MRSSHHCRVSKSFKALSMHCALSESAPSPFSLLSELLTVSDFFIISIILPLQSSIAGLLLGHIDIAKCVCFLSICYGLIAHLFYFWEIFHHVALSGFICSYSEGSLGSFQASETVRRASVSTDVPALILACLSTRECSY